MCPLTMQSVLKTVIQALIGNEINNFRKGTCGLK